MLLALPTPPPPCAPATPTTSEKAPPSEIRVELRRGALSATIIWPLIVRVKLKIVAKRHGSHDLFESQQLSENIGRADSRASLLTPI